LEEADLLVVNCSIITMSKKGFIDKGFVAIKDRNVIAVGRAIHANSFRAEKKVNAEGMVALPGLINCHTHVPMTLFRGIAEDKQLHEWLSKTIWPLEAKLKPRDILEGALLGNIEMIKSGTTCFADMYFHEDMVAEAAKTSGLRGVLAPGIIEAGDRQRGKTMLREALEVARRYRGYADGRVSVRLGPHAVYSCSPSLLKEVRREASALGVGLHIHLAESQTTAEKTQKEHAVTEVGLLESLGFLNSDVLAAHCIHLTEDDMKVMAKRGVRVSYNPIANMKLAMGVPEVSALQRSGVTVGLGTDGPASNNTLDMFEVMKVGAVLQKTFYRDPRVLPAQKVLRMATVEGAQAVGLDDFIGTIDVGKRADIILIDLKKPHLTPLHDLYANIVYSARGSDVDTVIVNGRVLMENREVETLDEEKVMEKAQQTALDLVSR